MEPGEWEEATRIAPFWLLNEQREADLPTVAYIGYTETGVYVAFDCYDPEPNKISMQEIRRGADLSRDDHVEIAIEPSGLDIQPYTFRVNARGTQDESIPGGSVSNIRWRGDWKSAASRHSTGWSAEMWIPFRILRIPSGQQAFGIILRRYVPRQGVSYYYPNMGVTYDRLLHARWEGLQLPEILPPPIVLPYTQLDTTSRATDWRSGLDVKATFKGGATALLTVNPDFKNIARAVDSVSFSYVPRLIKETRPFFIEGDDFFPDTTLFYSGSIEGVDAAMKSFGTLGRWSYGALASTSEAQRAAAGRLGYQITSRSRAELQFAHDDRPGIHNTALGGGVVLTPAYPDGYASIAALYFRTTDNRTSSGDKMALSYWRERGYGRISFGGLLHQISRAFNPSLGYAPEVGFRGYQADVLYADQWLHRALQTLRAGVSHSHRRRLDGGVLDEGLYLWGEAIFRNQTALWGNVNLYHRPPYRDRTFTLGTAWNSRQLYNSGGVVFTFGREAGGNSTFVRFAQGVPFTHRSRLKLEYEHSRIDYDDPTAPNRNVHQFIATLNYDIDAERSIGGRYLGKGSRLGKFDELSTLYLTFRQQVRQGADIFLIFGDPNAARTHTRFAVKVILPW